MWKATAGTQLNIKPETTEDDDWETDPDFINNVSEQEQRWGSATIEGSGRTAAAIDMGKLRRETEEADALKKKKELTEGPNASFGYGGKFGVEKDRMDKSAVGHDYAPKLEKHVSQKDYSTGFGGKFGVQTDRVDKSAAGWDHKEKIEKHASQKDYASGFGGKFGVQSDRQDKSAVGWDHVEKIDKHESQKDYAKGFGGKFGVQSDRQDKSAVGWDHHEAPQKHESQTDHKIGFGGKFGVQTDRMDKAALSFGDEPGKVGTTYDKVKPDIGTAKPSDLRAKFEKMSSSEDSKPPSVTSSPAPRKNIHSKAAMFNNSSKPEQEQERTITNVEKPKQLSHDKMAFLTNTSTSETQNTVVEKSVGQLDHSKFNQFKNESSASETSADKANKVKEEIAQLRQMEQERVQVQQPVEPKEEMVVQEKIVQEVVQESTTYSQEEIYENLGEHQQQISPSEAVVQSEEDLIQEEEIVDTGLSAVALYDYAAGAEDEISFDPEDIITHIEMIDEGWWRGMCKGKYGLFPANYVQLHQ